MENGSRIHVSTLEDSYLTLHEAGLPLSACLELQDESRGGPVDCTEDGNGYICEPILALFQCQ